MICRACHRKVDPTRSFCTNCGSFSFSDEGEAPPRRLAARRRLRQTSERIAEMPEVAAQVRRAARAAQQAGQPAQAAQAVAAQFAGCLTALVRLGLLLAALWYGSQWLLSIPEVVTLKDALVSGAFSDDQASAAAEAVRTRLRQLFGGSPPPADPEAPGNPRREPRRP
jgi:hypothetical protein